MEFRTFRGIDGEVCGKIAIDHAQAMQMQSGEKTGPASPRDINA
jgi:hypothetical protein